MFTLMSSLKPGDTWPRKHAKRKKFIQSGPPRDIVGLRDLRQIGNPYQRDVIEELEKRDNYRSLGSKTERHNPELPFPEEIPIPNNQKMMWYVSTGMEFASLHQFGKAYWYFTVAAYKARLKGRMSTEVRYLQSAASNLNEWRSVRT